MKKILGVLLISLFFLTSCGKSSSVDIVNPDAEYLYFYGATCPHCQELNRIAEEENLFSKIAVEKREVYFNNANREIFLKLVEEIKPERDGVPFVYDKVTGTVAVGVEPALELLKSRLNATIEEIVEDEEKTPDTMTGEVMDEINSQTGSETETTTWTTSE